MNKYSKIRKFFEFKPNDRKHQSTHDSMKAIISDATPFVIKETYKTARTNIIFSVAGIAKDGCKLIAVTSANPGEGKTTTSLNLAITFAQTGARTLIIDCDLRKPRLHRYIGIKKNIGVTTILSNQASIEKATHKNVRDGLDMIASGEIPPNPAELLASDTMKSLINTLSEKYDYIFFDTPPVNVVTDASALSAVVDGVVMVVRQNYTDHESLMFGLNLLNIAKAKILGFFVNDVVTKRGGTSYGRYRYKYGYKYSYKYGYRYDYHYGGISNKNTGEYKDEPDED